MSEVQTHIVDALARERNEGRLLHFRVPSFRLRAHKAHAHAPALVLGPPYRGPNIHTILGPQSWGPNTGAPVFGPPYWGPSIVCVLGAH